MAGGQVRTWRWDDADGPTDRAWRRLLQVGGIPEQSLRSGDTWTWSGGDWTLAQPSAQPRWLPFGALAAVPGTGQALLLTGATGDGQTWVWSGDRWRPAGP